MQKKTSSIQNESVDKKYGLTLLSVLLVSVCLFSFRLGDRPLRNPDEGRYAEIAREMVVSGDWGLPTLYGLAYLKKPILFYWLLAGSFRTFGMNEWAARSIPAFFGVLGVLAVFSFCIRHYDKKTAIFASVILTTNFWYLQVGRYLVIDMVFTFFTVAASFSFYHAVQGQNAKEKNYYLLFFAFMGCAFLTKGPVALATTGLSILIYLITSGNFRKVLPEMRWVRGLAIFCVIVLPWFVWTAVREPDFLSLFFGHENWNRVFSPDFEHQQPWYYYGMVLVPMMLPWVIFWRPAKAAFVNLGSSHRTDPRFFLTLSGVVTILFYSLARAKMSTYILPALVFFSIPLGYGWRQWTEEAVKTRHKIDMAAVGVMMFLAIGVITVTPWYVLERSAGKYPEQIVRDFQWIGGILLAGGVLCMRSIRQDRRTRLFFSLSATLALMSLLFPLAMETMNASYSTKAFAETLKSTLKEEDEVYLFDHPGPFYDLAFYLNRDVKLVGLEGELVIAQKDKNASKVSVNKADFMRALSEGKALYCLTRRSDFMDMSPEVRGKLTILKEDRRKILFRSGGTA